MAKKELMLDKNTIQKAIEESQLVKKDYPNFWKFYEMLLELNNGLTYLEASMTKNKKRGGK